METKKIAVLDIDDTIVDIVKGIFELSGYVFNIKDVYERKDYNVFKKNDLKKYSMCGDFYQTRSILQRDILDKVINTIESKKCDKILFLTMSHKGIIMESKIQLYKEIKSIIESKIDNIDTELNILRLYFRKNKNFVSKGDLLQFTPLSNISCIFEDNVDNIIDIIFHKSRNIFEIDKFLSEDNKKIFIRKWCYNTPGIIYKKLKDINIQNHEIDIFMEHVEYI
jgi:hypothetical protein